MCDTIPGELLICYRLNDPAANFLREQIAMKTIPHIAIVENLGSRLARLGLTLRRGLKFDFMRLEVPIGQEDFQVNILYFHYRHAVQYQLMQGNMNPRTHRDILDRPEGQLQVVPHRILTLAATGASTGIGFAFSPTHDDYKKKVGIGAGSASGAGMTVLILDSGVDSTGVANVVDQRNFVDPANRSTAADDTGHGTAVASIIHDLAPSADLIVYKVADENGRASEWDTLAALAARSSANIVNMSLAFGLTDWNTANCGRESQSSRSSVFETMINELADLNDGPLIVAAAGNESDYELSFPARFRKVIAVESLELSGGLSDFSNRATIDHQGDVHPNVFALPGGQQLNGQAPTEYVGTTASGEQFCGTSFAAAYASGLIAAWWSSSTNTNKDHTTVLKELKANADNTIPNYDRGIHGNGLMQYV
jgi:hypothetical protein